MADHHFTFLGVCDIEPTADDPTAIVDGTALGILAGSSRPPLTPFPGSATLVVSKEPQRSRVHRDAYLDAVAVRVVASDGGVERETRFLGLWTSSAYHASPSDIPVLRRKVTAVVQRAGYPHDSHAGKDLAAVLDTYPRDQLFQIGVEELYETAIAIVHLQERRRVRLFLRTDPTGQFVSALVFVPRDRYNTTLRLRIASILGDTLHAEESEWTSSVSDAPLARLHFVLRVAPGALATVRSRDLERQISAASRSWAEELRDALVAAAGTERGPALARRWADAFPPAYRDDIPVAAAVADVLDLDRLEQTGTTVLRLEAGRADGVMPFSVIGPAQLSLSDVMPILGHLGVRVVDEHPYVVGEPTARAGDDREGASAIAAVHLARFGIRSDAPGVDLAASRDDFEDAFAAVLAGDAENDAFGALVLGASLAWREVAILRAYRALPAPDRHAVLARLHRERADRSSRHGARARGVFPGPLRPPSHPRRARCRPGGPARRARPDARGRHEPRRRPNPAAASPRSSMPRSVRTGSSVIPRAGRRRTSCTSSSRRTSPKCRDRCPTTRSSSTRRTSRACTCAWERSHAAGCAGATGARTSAPRCSGSSRRRP